jgi:hypothetical protein
MRADVFFEEPREARRLPVANKTVPRGRWLQQACSECQGARRREQPSPPTVPCQRSRLAQVRRRVTSASVSKQLHEVCRLLAPTSSRFERHYHEPAPARAYQFCVFVLFVAPGTHERGAILLRRSWASLPVCSDSATKSNVNRELRAVKTREPRRQHLDGSAITRRNSDVPVFELRVCPYARTSLATDPRQCPLCRGGATAQAA